MFYKLIIKAGLFIFGAAVSTISMFIFGEKLGAWAALAILLIVGGLVLLKIDSEEKHGQN